MIRGMFQHTNNINQFLIAFGVFLFLNFFSTALALGISFPLFNLNIDDFGSLLTNITDPRNVAILKMVQIIVSLFSFVLGSLLLARIFSENSQQYLSLDRRPALKFLLTGTVLVMITFPLINFLGELFHLIQFPDFLKGLENYLDEKSKANQELLESFLSDSNPKGLMINILMVGILPAIGEELFFRGIVQNIFSRMTRNHHWGIWISAALFSLIHMEFSGFIPRMVLGAMFGYMLVWTGSIWVPILAHFVNNLSGVIMYYFVNTGRMSKEAIDYGSTTDVWPYILLSAIASTILIWYFYKNAIKPDKEEHLAAKE